MFRLSKSLSKLKTVSKSETSLKSQTLNNDNRIKTKKSKKVAKPEAKGSAKEMSSGVVRIGNIPHGFYEKQMFGYFSQFGKVLRIRISKNRKTGKRRNYGFIEFECEEVAKIVAQTMNNYLMFDHILKCEFITKEKLKERPKLFKNWDKEFVSSTLIHKSLHNKNKSIEKEFQLTRKRLRKVRQMETILKEKGLDFKCHVIGLPDMTQLRQQVNVVSNKTEVETKTPKQERLQSVKPKSFETIVLSSKSCEKRRKSLKTLIYPRLLKFSILLSANKKRIN